MKRTDSAEIRMRPVIDRPVSGMLHSLQSKDGQPLGPPCSRDGKPLAFDFAVRVGPGHKFFGDQVRREGPARRFFHARVGQATGGPASPWSRRMKIDIHDIEPALLERAARGGIIVATVCGTGEDGSPACATVRAVRRQLAEH